MSRVHLGMKRPIRQFERNYRDLIDLIDEIEERPPTNKKELLDDIDFIDKNGDEMWYEWMIQTLILSF